MRERFYKRCASLSEARRIYLAEHGQFAECRRPLFYRPETNIALAVFMGLTVGILQGFVLEVRDTIRPTNPILEGALLGVAVALMTWTYLRLILYVWCERHIRDCSK